MSKFNKNTNGINATINKSGFKAYKMQEKEKLVTMVLTSFFGEKKFYGDNTNELIVLAKTILEKEPKFVANLARYARKEMHLRSVSHALTCLVANNINSKPFIKNVVNDVVERADDITEILSCYITMFGKPIANGLKKALGNSLGKFNEYQISKHNGGNKSVKFRDVLRLLHTKPKNEEQAELFKKIMTNTLAIAERWETELSANGNNSKTWEKLIAENKIGYMAGLRNLRNIIESKAENIDVIFDMIENKEKVLKSKQLPFRFYSAYKELEKVSKATTKAFNVLENAIEHSIENIEKIKGKTIIAIDVSFSMGNIISKKSTIECQEIAALLGAMANKICEETILYTFDTEIKKHIITQRNGILRTAKQLSFNGGGTDISLSLKEMLKENIYADRLIILSDNEANSQWNKTCQPCADRYRNEINKNLWIHAIDLQGYGTQQFIGGKTNIIAGWSEKVLEFINIAEKGFDTMVDYIEKYDIK